MTTSKKRKSSTSVQVFRPYVPQARILNFHCNNKRTRSTATRSQVLLSAASSETLRVGTPGSSNQPKSDIPDNPFSEYIVDQIDIQHNDPTELEANDEGKDSEKSKTRNESAPCRSGSCIEILTSRKCFATMDEKDNRKRYAQNVVI